MEELSTAEAKQLLEESPDVELERVIVGHGALSEDIAMALQSGDMCITYIMDLGQAMDLMERLSMSVKHVIDSKLADDPVQ